MIWSMLSPDLRVMVVCVFIILVCIAVRAVVDVVDEVARLMKSRRL